MIGYTAFAAPALLAASAMDGAVHDSTFNVFFKLKHASLDDAVRATPVGRPTSCWLSGSGATGNMARVAAGSAQQRPR